MIWKCDRQPTILLIEGFIVLVSSSIDQQGEASELVFKWIFAPHPHGQLNKITCQDSE